MFTLKIIFLEKNAFQSGVEALTTINFLLIDNDFFRYSHVGTLLFFLVILILEHYDFFLYSHVSTLWFFSLQLSRENIFFLYVLWKRSFTFLRKQNYSCHMRVIKSWSHCCFLTFALWRIVFNWNNISSTGRNDFISNWKR